MAIVSMAIAIVSMAIVFEPTKAVGLTTGGYTRRAVPMGHKRKFTFCAFVSYAIQVVQHTRSAKL